MEPSKQRNTQKAHSTNIKLLNIDSITTDNQQLIVDTFNNSYVTIAVNIKTKDRMPIYKIKTPQILQILIHPHSK
jgi:hypothetical protein